MQQLLLDLGPPPAPTLDNFVVGANAAVLASLRAAAAGNGERQIHLWGPPGSGRSHLLRALAARPTGRYHACGSAPLPAFDPAATLWCLDDVERCDAAEQVRLFSLINAVRDQGQATLITSAAAPPLHLLLDTAREDLRTRLGWGPVFRVAPLTDDEKLAALEHHARSRGLDLAPEVGRYLITRFARDLPSLLQWIERLDSYALRQHRQVTLPLIRDYLREAGAALRTPA